MNRQIKLLILVMTLLLSACDGLGQTPPPPPYSIESLGTAVVLTENAPPTGYDAVAFPLVDAGLSALPGYHYVLSLRFEGNFDDDRTATTGHIQAEVWWDSIAPARRVLLDAGGDAFTMEARQFEAVRMGEDYYLVNAEGLCLSNVAETARGVALLDAGSLIGGVAEAPYSGTQAVLNSVQAFRYDVSSAAATLPLIQADDASTVELTGELWVAPENAAVVRYYANVDVSRVRLFESDRSVSGQLFLRYDVYDVGVVPNISIPYGC
ncbi:hypothetical protein ACFLYO_04035 [Chloroflexota bacterium]